MLNIPRYCPDRPLPPYSYVPGLAPHPISDPKGHSFGVNHAAVHPLDEASFATNETYRYAIDLFNHGFYWEAHEEWESLWHAAGRSGPTADFLKGLIKLAAAGVKLREGRPAGVKQHALRAAELIGNADAANASQTLFGLELNAIRQFATKLAQTTDPNTTTPDASRTLPFLLMLTPDF